MPVSIALIADKIAIGIAGTIAMVLKTDTVAEMVIDDSTITIYITLISFLFRFNLDRFGSHSANFLSKYFLTFSDIFISISSYRKKTFFVGRPTVSSNKMSSNGSK